MTKRPLWPMLLMSALALIVLLNLGFWQLRRLAEKEAQIAAIDAKVFVANPVTLTEAMAREGKGENVEYIKVTLSGSYLGTPLQKIATFEGRAAQDLIQPFLTNEKDVILVVRGALPDGQTLTDLAPQNVLTTGYLRRHDKGQGIFDNENIPEGNRWYWWDVPAMLGTATLPEGARPTTWVLHRLPDEHEKSPPFAAKPKAELKNNHLGYAVTWFGLAAVVVVMAGALTWQRRRN